MNEVRVKIVSSYLPAYATSGSAGVDLKSQETILLEKGKRALIGTGVFIALPEGYEAQIRSRSGLAYKNGIFVLNSPGTIDSDYRGEIKVNLMNLGEEDFNIEKDMRIAQMVFSSYTKVSWESVETLNNTERKGGMGSTGI